MKLVWSLLALVGSLGAAAPFVAAENEPGVTLHSVALEVRDARGQRSQATFEVAAPDQTTARSLAERALARLAPHATPAGAASAQWLPWAWKWDLSELPVPIAYNPSGAPEDVGPDAFIAGLTAWSNVEGSAFRYRYAGITDNIASILELGPDGENVISWAFLPCEQGCVLGITSKQDAHEVDMLLNNNPAAALQLGVGATVDWRTVILHELGHMAGLEHSCPVPFGPCTPAEADAVMYYQYRGILRRLAEDDTAGLAALYPASSLPFPTATPATPATPGPQPTPTPFPEFPVILEEGWNFLLLPAGPLPFITTAMPCIEAVYEFQHGQWLAWIQGLPEPLQQIELIHPERPYWLLTNRACAHIF